MIGRQTQFYVDPGDYAALADGLRSLGAVLLSDWSPTPEPTTVYPGNPAVPVSALVTSPVFLAKLRPRFSHHQDAWLFSEANDPLIQLHLWPPHEGVLRPGRVYFTTRSLEGDEVELRFEAKSPEFIAFAERVRRFVRRWCEKRDGLLVSPSLAARFDAGNVAREGVEGLKLLD